MTVPSVPSPPSLPPSAPPAPPDAPPGELPKAVRGQWSRLHPFSPVLRFSRAAAGLVVLLAARRTSPGGTHGGEWIWDLAVLALAVVGGVVAWAVTRWRVEGSELQIETGLIRRQSVRVPLSRVQSIDVVRPLLARAVGVSELRVEVAGHGSGKSKLAYLGEDEALRVRARLLAVAHGLDEDTPEPLQRPLWQVGNGRLIASLLLGPVAASMLMLAAIVVAAFLLPSDARGGLLGVLVPFLLAVATAVKKRLNNEFSFSVAEAPDGLRLHSGLTQTRAETIPYGRVQAMRFVQPLLWRPFGWVRLEIDVARQRQRDRDERESNQLVRAVLPVGTRRDAELLLSRVFPGADIVPPSSGARPPGRARWRSPLSYWSLLAWDDGVYLRTRTGRVRPATVIVPLEKVQSLRYRQGPVERALRLATVHADTAGRHWQARAVCRDAAEAERLLEHLTVASRDARRAGRMRSRTDKRHA
ncbi:MAG: putative rane protein [Frankiales bacterium]|nr:putative rane protein [Frankiales bacterium]